MSTGTRETEKIESTTAEDFLERLGARSTHWARDGDSEWLFRGLGDANWKLHPKAVHTPESFKEHGVTQASKEVPPTTPLERRDLINTMLKRFRQGLSRSGIAIPTSPPRIDAYESNGVSSTAEPSRESFPLMALAQHHGLPTILMDWSRRSWVAAYFASASASARKIGPSRDRLCVWALRRHLLLHDGAGRASFLEGPGSTNANLRAQAGVLSWFVTDDDESLENHFRNSSHADSGLVALQQFDLPVSEAPKLLRLLSYEGISGESMFPGPDGVVRAMKERALWDQPV